MITRQGQQRRDGNSLDRRGSRHGGLIPRMVAPTIRPGRPAGDRGGGSTDDRGAMDGVAGAGDFLVRGRSIGASSRGLAGPWGGGTCLGRVYALLLVAARALGTGGASVPDPGLLPRRTGGACGSVGPDVVPGPSRACSGACSHARLCGLVLGGLGGGWPPDVCWWRLRAFPRCSARRCSQLCPGARPSPVSLPRWGSSVSGCCWSWWAIWGGAIRRSSLARASHCHRHPDRSLAALSWPAVSLVWTWAGFPHAWEALGVLRVSLFLGSRARPPIRLHPDPAGGLDLARPRGVTCAAPGPQAPFRAAGPRRSATDGSGAGDALTLRAGFGAGTSCLHPSDAVGQRHRRGAHRTRP